MEYSRYGDLEEEGAAEEEEEYEETEQVEEPEGPPLIRQVEVEDDGDADGETDISDKLERVRRRLGLIRLSWQEHEQLGNLEKTLLWYAENFRRQFSLLYTQRKPLLLSCADEYGVQKFVSTTIRRTLLPYAELSTWQACAGFVSDFLSYEPPKEILLMPKRLCSPAHLIETQRANSFEFATFLTSLLLGLGYNAYVVSGYASREVSLCDQTKITCPYLPIPEKPEPPPPKVESNKYQLKPPPDFKSKFLEAIEDKKRQEVENETRLKKEEYERMVIEIERPAPDRYFGQRIHAWVVLLPGGVGPEAAEIAEPLFVEPSTGTSCRPGELASANLYLGVESVWNNRNYWVNMQDCTEACAKLDWDLANPRFWEHLLPGEPEHMRNVDDDEDPETNERRNFHMVMPASRVAKLELPYQKYELRYPNGHKTSFYKKTKVQLFAPYLRTDGLIESITKYEDYEYSKKIFIYEKFKHREDHLVRVEKNLQTDTATEFYDKGRAEACKVHQYVMSRNKNVDDERTLEFYAEKRFDELCRIKMHPLYASQDYANREDRLYNRFIEYSPFIEDSTRDNIHNRTITRIIERFRRNKKVPAHKDVDVQEFDFLENEIRLVYHYADGEYTQATRSFVKPPASERGSHLVFSPSMTRSYNPDPLYPPENFDDLIFELEERLSKEEVSSLEVRKGESEINRFLQDRKKHFAKPGLAVSLFDPIRNQEAREGLIAMEKRILEQSQQEVEGEVDFLKPYLAKLGNLKYLTKAQALQVREDCTNDFKNTAVDRANYMLRKFERFSEELQKMQSSMTQEDLTREEKEQLLEQISQMTLTLTALEARLNRHRMVVPEHCKKLMAFLRNSPVLSILYDE